MTANDLLFWLSARGQGTWPQFKAAVEELHLTDLSADGAEPMEDNLGPSGLPHYQVLRLNLQRLGHVEFSSDDGDIRWRVTPPTLALTDAPDGPMGVLVGARSDSVIRRVAESSKQLFRDIYAAPDCPDQAVFRGPIHQLRAMASQAGLLVQENAALALLSCIPSVDDPASRWQGVVPTGANWSISRWSVRDQTWQTITRKQFGSATNGLFKFSQRHQTIPVLVIRQEAFAVPMAVGKFVQLHARRTRILRYDRQAKRLTIPATYRPPFLVERALILCSGRPPKYEILGGRGVLFYDDVSDQVARSAATILRQETR
jgi:hypothetical protein